MPEQDPYALLGVPPNAKAEEIRKAYISRCKVLHPDRFDPKTQPKEWAQANEMHAELNRAYATLRNVKQRSSARASGAEAAHEQAKARSSTPDVSQAPQRPQRPFIDGRIIFLIFILGCWGLYMGVTGLLRESGIDKVPHHLSLIELRDGSVPDNRSLKISDVECDLGHVIEFRENYTPRAYYIPIVASSDNAKSEASLPDRKIILRLTKELYETHSRALQNAHTPLTIEGIRLLNTDIESRIADFLKKELGITKLGNVVVIDGGRQSIGVVLPLIISITYCVFLLGIFFTFVKKQKRVWAIVAIVCGWLALLPAITSSKPRYKSPLPEQDANATATMYKTEQKMGVDAHKKGSALDASGSQASAATNNSVPSSFDPELAQLRKAAEQGDPFAQYRLGLNFLLGLTVPQDDVESATWFRKAAKGGNADAEDLLHFGNAVYWGQKAKGPWGDYTISKVDIFRAMQGDDEAIFMLQAIQNTIKQLKIEGAWRGEGIDVNAKIYSQVICDLSGHGVRENAEEAVEWFRHRAERGGMMSQFQLGFIYEFARNNAEEAASWYRKAAEQGSPYAQLRLGELYRRGEGVHGDDIEALAWLNVAAANSINNPEGKKSFETQTILWARDSQKADKQRLGQKIAFHAQQRSKEILEKIEAAKANDGQVSKFIMPNETDWAGTVQSGAGVFVTEDGLILTAAHVLEGAATIRIETLHGTKLGRLIKVDAQHDLALVKCEGKFQPIPVIAARDVKLGQVIFTIGFPKIETQGFNPKMTRGEISSLAGFLNDPLQWQISVPVPSGNSGGPLLDEAGNVIGIIGTIASEDALFDRLVASSRADSEKLTGDVSQNVNYALKCAPVLQLLAPYSDKLPRERKVNSSKNVVEQCRESVVLIFGWRP